MWDRVFGSGSVFWEIVRADPVLRGSFLCRVIIWRVRSVRGGDRKWSFRERV